MLTCDSDMIRGEHIPWNNSGELVVLQVSDLGRISSVTGV